MTTRQEARISMMQPRKPRSLILDLFGDYLRYVGCEVRAGDLVALLGVLGVEPATARVTLSRLRQEGWFTTRRTGRETIYRLSDEMLDVLDQGRERIFAPYESTWDGWWTQVIVQSPESDRSTRDQLRKRLSWMGFGALSPSTWLSPRDLRRAVPALQAEFPAASIDLMVARTDDPVEDGRLAHRCWDLETLNADYSVFVAEHSALRSETATLEGAEALVVRTELVSTYRHFPFRDPSLPTALRPAGWFGAQAHELFLELHDALAPAAMEYVAAVIDIDTIAFQDAPALARNV
ncbi:phenylacetic acid-responsive transcriptional repressor [Rathayibacter sp. VKM Ac-2929]|uniref:PaaX family transcriptional regulator n=1 Tax=Rathayibacter TaxID=33886 RepID=UPI001FB499F6|nr:MULTISPECIES: PaaX family transcriptional regulator C-terminal domain-containing protein [Rathayibacter]MCJ1675472.1 phenylacetic acid-responsive transcriptional repressor [Rathayibacter sp. VKM Ac-2929]MCJ1697738.1 phenylacetic acid-responsive transcriptional repressor [Rathayibacter caricis]